MIQYNISRINDIFYYAYEILFLFSFIWNAYKLMLVTKESLSNILLKFNEAKSTVRKNLPENRKIERISVN